MIKNYDVDDLCCGQCAQRLEIALNKLPGVEAKVFFSLGRIKIIAPEENYDKTFREIKRILAVIEPDATIKEV